MANKDFDRTKQPPQSDQGQQPAAGRKNTEEVGEPVQLNEDVGEPVQLDEDMPKQQGTKPGVGKQGGQSQGGQAQGGQPPGGLPGGGQPGRGQQQGNR